MRKGKSLQQIVLRNLDSHMQKNAIDPQPHIAQKKKKRIHKDLNAKTETLKYLEENTRGDLFNMTLGNDFFNMTPKASGTKAKIKSGTSSN